MDQDVGTGGDGVRRWWEGGVGGAAAGGGAAPFGGTHCVSGEYGDLHCNVVDLKQEKVSDTFLMAEYSSSSAAADEVAGNSDLLTEILIRLPVRSLMMFKSVSKHWLSLITSDFFALRRNPDSTAVSGLLLHPYTINNIPQVDFIPTINTTETQSKDPHPHQFTDLTFFPNVSGNIRIVNSCHGLILCCFRHTRQNNNPDPEYIILNPTTKQFRILPKCHPSDLIGLTIAFNPSKSPHYKVVCVRHNDLASTYPPGPCHHIMTYSSETGSWKASGAPFAAEFQEQYNVGVYWNGAINWFSTWRWRESLYYNVEEERLGTLPLPPIPEDNYGYNREFRYYGESRGHLHLVVTYDRGGPMSRIDVYEIEIDYSGWFVKFSVDLDAVGIIPRDTRPGRLSVLCVVRMERDDESFLVLHVPGKILRYGFGDGTLKKICDVAVRQRFYTEGWVEDQLRYFWCDSYQYIESLSNV
ncbi:hypothetical protein Vadar_021040 [Vaccinium darrowii]|uniref:Uncharacterized protein n=1 Tax=Vaccinium darrowii TaxID=229202 RepID=A0ACB7YN70_9ERIC|nr:hypothetical protein Vadar_021040 [Vaccinium darrowii]